MRRGTDWADACEARMESLRLAIEHARTVAEERRNRHAAHLTRAPGLDADEIARSERTGTDALRAAEERLFGVRHRLERDDEVRVARADRQVALGEQHRVSHVWRSMADLIGSSDGKKFRVFAQSLTFDALLEQSNSHLREISSRYALMRVPGSDLELQVVDHDMADEVRPVTSLSGGESFLVSLALALGLSTLGNPRARVETLFIDEGFGTLDADTLDVALASLEALQASVRQVGLISHVSGLADRLAARIVVQRQGPGRSRVLVERS
jgi:exonuclease SbcC